MKKNIVKPKNKPSKTYKRLFFSFLFLKILINKKILKRKYKDVIIGLGVRKLYKLEKNKRLYMISDISVSYINLYKSKRGISNAKITTAVK